MGVLVVLLAASCRRQAVVTSTPSQPQSTPPAANLAGGATALDALTRFLAAVKVQDVQALSHVWGTKDAGPASGGRYMSQEVMEQRLIILIRCARHDSWSVRSETPMVGGDRQFTVELKLRNLTGVTDFVAVQGPSSRWYIREYDVEKVMRTICQSQ